MVLKQQSRLKFPRRRRQQGIKLSILLIVIIFASTFFISTEPVKDLLISPPLRCVQISNKTQSQEGLGALVRRNQFAFLIADTYNADVSFPSINSSHGYDISNLFDQCPEPASDCVLNQATLKIYRCPRGDCHCLRAEMRRHVSHLARRCSSLLVHNDNARTMEFSGCIKSVLTKYLGKASKPVPNKNLEATREWDAVHYRAGDLTDSQLGKKAFLPQELYFVLKEMCTRSGRDIVVLTEDVSNLPRVRGCQHRILLARDTPLLVTLAIARYAKTLSVGRSAFAMIMAELASPDTMMVMQRDVTLFDWMPVQDWTVFFEFGIKYHFNDRQFMRDTSFFRRNLEGRSYRTRSQLRAGKERVRLLPPRRFWEKEYYSAVSEKQ